MLKSGIRILAVEDSPFNREEKKNLIVGVIGREQLIEGVLSAHVAVDGDDATERLIKMVKRSRFKEQIALIVLNGITFAGLNVVDLVQVNKELKVPIMAITRKRPRVTILSSVLKKYGNKSKLAKLKRIRENIEIIKAGGYYAQVIGINEKEAQKILPKCAELLRTAHLISSGVTTGESRGRL
jgi:uncharacterized protein